MPNSARKKNNYPRYTATPFPSYRFIPGENPHPIDDPKGHSYKKSVAIPISLEIQNWNIKDPLEDYPFIDLKMDNTKIDGMMGQK